MNLDFEEQAEGNSLLHRLDARVKIVCAAAVVVGVVFFSHWQTAFVVLAACLGLAVYSRASMRVYLKRLLYPSYIIIFISAIQLFMYGTTVIATVPTLGLPIYQEGVSFAVLIFTRCLAAVAVLNLLILVTSLTALLDSLAWFRIPSVMVDTTMLMFRYVSIISEESARMHKAQESRCGYSRSLGFLRKVRNYGTIAGMLLVRAFDRALKVGDAMASRGYTGKYRIFTYQKRDTPPRDFIAGLLVILAIVALILADIFVL
jgi:cobalt/nickel transport system permease protein